MCSKPSPFASRRVLMLALLSLAQSVPAARASLVMFSVGGTSATSSVQSTIDSFCAALGGPNNGSNLAPLAGGRREIHRDCGGATTAAVSGPVRPEPTGAIFAGIGSLSALGYCIVFRRSANHARKKQSQLYSALRDAMFYRIPDVGAAGKQRYVSSKEIMTKNISPLAQSRRTTIFRDRPFGWRMIALALIVFSQLATGVAWATINIGTTTVTSIGHSFEPEDPTPATGHAAIVTDFLVNQTQEVGGGAMLPPVTVNLDSDTSLSFTIAAPAGEKFLIRLPAGSSANMSLSLAWQTGAFGFGNPVAFNTSFQNLVGAAPSFPGSSVVSDNNQAFDFDSSTPMFSNDFSFTSVTFTAAYSPRTLGQGPLTYQPAGSIAPFGTTARNANFVVTYATTGKVDPGRFVSLVSVVSGDYNNDGIVDAADYAVWSDSLGSKTSLAADGNGNGIIDAGDFEVWRSHFGETVARQAALSSNAAVSEPASALLLLVGLLTMCARRRAIVS
jgi:dockerin type I repeat protein